MDYIRRAGVLVAAVLAATCLPAVTAGAAPVAATAPVCSPAVDVFGVEPDGRLFVYPHNEPETGVASWGAKRYIGTGWNGGTVHAAPGGYLHYVLSGTSQHRRYRWTGSGWATFGGSQYQDLGQLSTPWPQSITVDERGRVLQNGTLGVTAQTWDEQGRQVGQEHPLGLQSTTAELIASGDGAFFRRVGDALSRYRYDFETNRWIQTNQIVGSGFGVFKRLFGGGGGVLYGVANDPAGTLLWYRYDENTGTWANNGIGKVVGSGWGALAGTTAVGCATPQAPAPDPLPAPHNERPTVKYNEVTRTFEAAWVNNNGELLFGKENPQDPTAITWTPMTGYQKYTGAASLTYEYGNGRAVVTATSQDSRGRAHVQQPGGGFSSAINTGGVFRTGPMLLTIGSESVDAYGIDHHGTLMRTSKAGNEFKPWVPVAQGIGPKSTITLPYTTYNLLTLNSAGDVELRRSQLDYPFSQPKLARGLPGMGMPVLTRGQGGFDRLVASDGNGKLWAALENADGFDAWTDISGGLTFTGAVDTLRWDPNRTDLVARTTDGTVVRRVVTDWAAEQPWIPIGTSTVDPVITSGSLQKGKVVLLIDASGQAKLAQFPYFS
ncbi:tachylectin-related carbohydrate-binding protein [Actinokineospora diospyrosa]|nr:tachylectin-related carbohydrate-binding protein [Actinokineospora diospyrosa]